MSANQSVVVAYVIGLALLLGYALGTAMAVRSASRRHTDDRTGGRP